MILCFDLVLNESVKRSMDMPLIRVREILSYVTIQASRALVQSSATEWQIKCSVIIIISIDGADMHCFIVAL
ncbi:unnamed protein product [Cochlearia groenlandica]